VGRRPYPRCDQGNDSVGFLGYVFVAADYDGVLLLKNCLCANAQGNYHIFMAYELSISAIRSEIDDLS